MICLVFFFGALSSTSSSVQCISRPHPSLPTHSLSGEAQFYLGMALSQNTKKTYSSGMRQFYSFCSQTGLTPTFPINEDILIHSSVCMARSVQHSTIKKLFVGHKALPFQSWLPVKPISFSSLTAHSPWD